MPQLATRAVPLHTTQLPMSSFRTSPSNYEAHTEVSRGDSLAATGKQRWLTPLRCPVGQYREPFTPVCKPFLPARTGEDKVPSQLQLSLANENVIPLGFNLRGALMINIVALSNISAPTVQQPELRRQSRLYSSRE
jgi:hypothetical protein